MRLFNLLFILLFYASINAQTDVSGIVTSDEGPIIGATVYNVNEESGTITDIEGAFTLIGQVGDRLDISFLGYETVSMFIDDELDMDIFLNAENVNLDQVVVTALGLERESKSLGYAVQQLDGSEISAVKSVNFLDNLGGKLAGISINQGATGVGSSSLISIRGEASFTNNNPLFIVDGLPINNNSVLNVTDEKAAGFQEVDYGNGAMDINPSDIQSLSVLKGPAAAALYGARASNGVIIIKTKDGSLSKGLGVSINSTTYVETAFKLPDFQNKYGQGNNGAFEFKDGLGGGINDNITYSYGPELDQGILIPQFDSPVTLPDGSIVRGGDINVHGGQPITPTQFNSHPDNLKNFYQTGSTKINNIAISNSFDKGSFRLSFTDLRSTSIIPGVDFNRQNIGANMTFKPAKKLRVTSSINYAKSDSKNRPASGYGSENINYSLVAWLGRQSNVDALKEYWQPGLQEIQQYSFNYTFFDNPYFILNENKNALDRGRLFGNINASYLINDKLSVSLRTGLDNNSELRSFRRAFSSNRFRNGAYAEHQVGYREHNTDFLINYQESINSFGFDFSFGGNRMDQMASTKQQQALSLAQPGIYRLSNAAAPIEVFEFESRKRINSLYGLAKFSYKNFLFVDVTGRNDWSSALASPNSTDNTSFFYPSVSTSLLLDEIIDLPSVISFAKVRASYGEVGNDTNPYQTAGVFNSATPYNGQPAFTDQATIANANLLPERTSALELGGDIRFLNDRISLDFTYYTGKTENQILALPIPISSGYSQRVLNGGVVKNEGIEILLQYNILTAKRLRWRIGANFSKNVGTVESLPDEAENLTLAYSRVYDNPNQTVWFIVSEGDKIGDLWGTGYLRDDAGNFIIGEDGKYIVDNTLKKLGNYNPDFTIGLFNQITYKNWSANATIDWRQGGQIVSRTQALAGVAGQLIETENRPDEGIIAQGVDINGNANTVPISAESYYRQYYDRNHEENNTLDASYLKLREIGIGYSFDKLWNIPNLKVSLIGRNLFAISKIKHFDPEQIAVQGNNFVRGVEDMSYATTRSFGLSVNLDF